MIEEKEEIWIAEVVTAEMTEEVVAAVIEEVAVVRAEEVADLVVVEEVVDPAVVEEVAVAGEQVAAEEEDKVEIETKIKNKKLVTRNFIKCYNRKDRNTGKCRKAV